MIRNYLKIAWRNLKKSQVFSFLNIFGLALGLSSFLLISLYITDELSYDRFHENAARIYRVHTDIRFGGTDLHLAVSSDPMGATLKKDYPEVEQFTRLYSSSGAKLIKNGDTFVNEGRVTHADSTVFEVFTLPAVAGQTRHSLDEPNTVVITESAARRYFGGAQEALNQTLETDDQGSTLYRVTAVIEDLPEQSHFDVEFFFSMDNVDYDFGNFMSNNFHTYVLLREDADPEKFEAKLGEVVTRYIEPLLMQYLETDNLDGFRASGNRLEYSLMPLTDIHLHSDRMPELGPNGDIQNVYLFAAAALFVLVIACVNFMNLSTARSAGRAREVGIRKTLGTGKNNLMAQFLTESIVLTSLAMILAIGLCLLALPWFNGISGKSLSPAELLHPGYLAFLLVLPLVVGSLAGVYPAFFLASFRPIQALKGIARGPVSSEPLLRSALVVFQFAISILLIVGTLVIFNQLEYIRKTKVGFDKEQVLLVETNGISRSERNAFRNEVAALSGIEASSFGGYLPVSNSSRSDTSFSTDPVMTESNGFNMQIWRVDYDYIPTLGMEIIAGRNFSPDYGSDSTALILNERAASLLETENPVGEKLYFNLPGSEETTAYDIIGVVRNFNYESLRQNVGPLAFRLGNNSWVTAFRLAPGNVENLLGAIETRFRKVAPGMPFNYTFLDESFDSMYRQEQRMGKVALSFAVLAIIIACLGLFGLVTYVAEKRTKEIGIRKVLGASLGNILALLSREFLLLVGIAFVIATPIAWWAMHNWLQGFAYRTPISFWVFALTGLAALGIALLTIGLKALRAAGANPVDSLRTE